VSNVVVANKEVLDVETVLLFLLFMEFPDQVSCCFHLDVEVVLLFLLLMEFSDQVSNEFRME
jgi:hypothetical protein